MRDVCEGPKQYFGDSKRANLQISSHVPFLYSVKTSENQSYSEVFRGVIEGEKSHENETTCQNLKFFQCIALVKGVQVILKRLKRRNNWDAFGCKYASIQELAE